MDRTPLLDGFPCLLQPDADVAEPLTNGGDAMNSDNRAGAPPARGGLVPPLVLEPVSQRWRGLMSGLLQEGYTFGNLLAALAFRTIYPLFGWRALFVVLAIG
jgi:hypothetical protein